MANNTKSGVYVIEHQASGRCYIGSSKSIRSRFGQHRTGLRAGSHHSPYLQNAWNKYGEDAFRFWVIEECSVDDLELKEQQYIDAFSPVFNVIVDVKRRTLTPEAEARRVEALRARAAAITHCPHGHEYTPENTSFMRNKWRTRLCKECARIRTRTAIAAETPEQTEYRLKRDNENYWRNYAEKRAKQNEYAAQTRDKKREYDRAHLAEKRARRARARAEGRKYG